MLDLFEKIIRCNLCQNFLAFEPRPVVQLNASSRVIIIGQAPGRKVHETGIPWNDASGKTLRSWLGITETEFYDPQLFSIMPMGFCYPGKGISGDLAPRRECAPLWHPQILEHFESKPLILLIGQYAQRYYLREKYRNGLTETVKHYADYLPQYFPLPHPSPRNQNWLKVNPWFAEEVIPALQTTIQSSLSKP
ncbi:uracil-DNA glycosylase family protein [Desertivirga xinjiangensis]|uniref:uracil-DNA glycosylase family protein n=1 Tax=Desertivirga xinjiangensis TaxID=539206 RepID=UPI00210CC88E|nr:uracil-DNA glycosylase family protein [Pedobacter xinjiangensis]